MGHEGPQSHITTQRIEATSELSQLLEGWHSNDGSTQPDFEVMELRIASHSLLVTGWAGQLSSRHRRHPHYPISGEPRAQWHVGCEEDFFRKVCHGLSEAIGYSHV